MKKMVMLALVLLPLALAGYEESIHEGIYLVRPDNDYLSGNTSTYISAEDMTFFACIEYKDTPVRLSVLCQENNDFVDVTATKWGTDNCYIGSLNLDDFPCFDALIVADYIHDGENLRITKDVRINKVTGALQTVLDTQYEDGGWSSALDTAFSLYSLKPFEDVFQDTINKGLLYLKNHREETEKCWPEDQCQISTTAAILYLLSAADYNDDLRVVRDGAIYLDKSMNYIESDEDWYVHLEDHIANLNNTVPTQCVFGYDDENTTYNLSSYGTIENISVDPAYDSTIRVVCTETINADVFSTVRGRLIHYTGDNLSYVIPGPCWTFNNENATCDLRTTAYAVGTPIDSTRKDAAISYLEGQLNSSILGTYFSDGDIMNLALFISSAGSEVSSTTIDDMIKYLLYRQANKGAWNATTTYYNESFYEPQDAELQNKSHVLNDSFSDSIVYTGFATQALLSQGYTRDDEMIIDADRWVSVNEDTVTQQLSDDDATDEDIVALYERNVTDILNDPKRNSMALYVLQQHARPFIKTYPSVIFLDKPNITIDLINPTTFTLEDLTYELDNDLSPYLSIEEKDYLAPYSVRRIDIKQTATAANAFGYLRIKQGSAEYAKIPIIIEQYPSLNATFPQTLTVFGTSAIYSINFVKSSHTFSCTIAWSTPGISSQSAITVEKNGAYNLPIQFSRAATEETTYAGTLVCTAGTSTFTFPFQTRVNRFTTKPLAVSPASITLDDYESQAQFSIKNLLDESIDVTFGLREPNDYLEFSEYVVNLYPGESKNISIILTAPQGENITFANAILVKTFDIEERIQVQADIIYEPPKPTPLGVLVGVGAFAVGLLGLLGYFAYSNRKRLYEWYKKTFHKEIERKKIAGQIEEFERKEEIIAIKNMIQIMHLENASDKEVRKRLHDEGFSDADIDLAIKSKIDEKQPKAPQK